jgi:mono/diheme cytochrome c family protein
METKDRRNIKLTSQKLFLVMLSGLLCAVLISACGSTATPASSGTSAPVSYAVDVAPLFNQRCTQCHSGGQPSGGLDLSSYAGLMAGGARGAVITPGDAANSLLISLVSSGQMPKSGAQLTQDQVTMLENWVNAGATDK